MEEKKTKRRGRPKKVDSIKSDVTGNFTIYRPEYCSELVEKMSQGYSFSTFGAVIEVSKQTLYDWVEKFPDFKESKEIGFQKGKEFFETALLKKVSGASKADTSAIIFAMKTRFFEDYGEKKQIEADVKINSLADFVNENM